MANRPAHCGYLYPNRPKRSCTAIKTLNIAMTLEMIQTAVREAMPRPMMTEQEHAWVKLAIERQAQSIAFRRQVIEKSLTGLIWAGIVGLGLIVREYAIAHGMWRPGP